MGRSFLDDFWKMHDSIPPKIPNVVFSSLYSQVKQESGRTDQEGLTVDEMAEFAIKVYGFVFKSLGKEMREQKRLSIASERRRSTAAGLEWKSSNAEEQ